MKTLLFLILLVPTLAFAQLKPTNTTSRVYRLIEGDAMTMVSSAVDTAKDNALYSNSICSDLGGRAIIYGVNVVTACDTLTQTLVLEASIDDTTYTGIDSLSVTTWHTTGKKVKTVDLTTYRYPYWRLRAGAGSMALRGNKTPTGALYFFVVTNYQNRW
jgi:hypothetical protein